MNGKQFIRRARKWANANGQTLTVDDQGKGGHQTAGIGGAKTIVKTGEIGIGLLRKMLSDLGIPREDF